MRKSKSYVLIFALVILSLVVILTQQLIKTVYVGSHFDRTMIDREHAEMLAIGGINLAIAQLTLEKPRDKKEVRLKRKELPEEKTKRNKKELAIFLRRTLPYINRWKIYKLTEKIDGVDGELKLCISCEQGKININKAFDFKKNVFKPQYKKLLSKLKFQSGQDPPKLFIKKLTNWLKKRKRPLDDLSELQNDSLSLKFFYEPPVRTEKVKAAKPNTSIALQDLFTIWGGDNRIKSGCSLEALFLSDAMCSIFGFRRPRAYDAKLRKDTYKTIIKDFSPALDENSEKYWKQITPLYEPKSGFKIKDNKIFYPKFEPSIYSVLSSGKVGSVEQKLLAIIKKIKLENNSTFKIIRMYWI